MILTVLLRQLGIKKKEAVVRFDAGRHSIMVLQYKK